MWVLPKINILLKLNWLEYFVLEKVFKKRKYEIFNEGKLKGRKVKLVIVDEFVNIDEIDSKSLKNIKYGK